VAGPIIQATARSEFEDGSGDFVSGYSYHMSVRTRLSDHTKQTKFQSQRPSDVETPVPSFWVQKWSNIGTVSTYWGTALWVCVHPISKETAEQLLASGVVSHHASWGIDQNSWGHTHLVGTQYPLVGPGPMTCDPATSKTNKQTELGWPGCVDLQKHPLYMIFKMAIGELPFEQILRSNNELSRSAIQGLVHMESCCYCHSSIHWDWRNDNSEYHHAPVNFTAQLSP
jgi:hypothetical protein